MRDASSVLDNLFLYLQKLTALVFCNYIYFMRLYDENGKEMVVYTTEELAALQRLPGAGREMTDAEITAAALALAIQNFPEGAIISMPLWAEGRSEPHAFWYGGHPAWWNPLQAG